MSSPAPSNRPLTQQETDDTPKEPTSAFLSIKQLFSDYVSFFSELKFLLSSELKLFIHSLVPFFCLSVFLAVLIGGALIATFVILVLLITEIFNLSLILSSIIVTLLLWIICLLLFLKIRDLYNNLKFSYTRAALHHSPSKSEAPKTMDDNQTTSQTNRA